MGLVVAHASNTHISKLMRANALRPPWVVTSAVASGALDLFPARRCAPKGARAVLAGQPVGTSPRQLSHVEGLVSSAGSVAKASCASPTRRGGMQAVATRSAPPGRERMRRAHPQRIGTNGQAPSGGDVGHGESDRASPSGNLSRMDSGACVASPGNRWGRRCARRVEGRGTRVAAGGKSGVRLRALEDEHGNVGLRQRGTASPGERTWTDEPFAGPECHRVRFGREVSFRAGRFGGR